MPNDFDPRFWDDRRRNGCPPCPPCRCDRNDRRNDRRDDRRDDRRNDRWDNRRDNRRQHDWDDFMPW